MHRMDRLFVTGGARLHGSVRVSGAKNSALKVMAASLLAPGRSVLRNVPRILDCSLMVEVLEHLGARPIDLHLDGLRKMGARIDAEHGFLLARAERLTAASITLDYPSVGATENLMMAAVGADGVSGGPAPINGREAVYRPFSRSVPPQGDPTPLPGECRDYPEPFAEP